MLNYDHYKCGEIETLFCGTGGCQTEIFASDGEGGYVHVWDKLAQKVEFKTIGKAAGDDRLPARLEMRTQQLARLPR